MNKFFCCLFLSFFAIVFHMNAQTLTFTTSEYPPFLSEKLKHDGLFSYIISRALATQNYKAVFKYYPFKRGLNMAKTGKSDGSLGYYFTKERTKDFVFSEPILMTKEVFFYLKSTSFHWEDFSDLKKFKIGGPSGYAVTEFLESKDIKVNTAVKESLVLRKLVGKRHDAINLEFHVGHFLMKTELPQKDAEKIIVHPKPIYEKDLHVIFGKKAKNYNKNRDILNSGLEELMKSGEYNQILTKFRQGELF